MYIEYINKTFLEHDLSVMCNPLVIAAVKNAEGRFLTQKEIAQEAGISQPAVARAVEKMVSSGLLEKIEDERDRRCYNISITEKGKALFDEYLAFGLEIIPKIYKGISNEDLAALIRCSKKLIDNLKDLGIKAPMLLGSTF